MIRHAGYWKPTIYPFNGNVGKSEIDRLQELRGAPTLPVDQIYEIGRYEKVCSMKRPPEVALTLRQIEYGSLEFYRKMACKEGGNIQLQDFDDALFHIVGYEGDSSQVLKASILFPRCRLNRIGFSIGGPEDIIERSFDITADSKIIWQNNNKYFILKTFEIESGDIESDESVELLLENPYPIQDPDTSSYVYEVLKVRGNETKEIEEGAAKDFVYNNSTHLLTVQNCEIGDIIKVYYTSSSYISGQEYHEVNDIDACALYAYHVSIWLVDGAITNYLYRLNSIGIETSFDRQNVKEIGNRETVETGIRTRMVRVNPTGFVKDYSLEEIVRGVAGQNYGKIDIEKFKDTISIVVKVYSDLEKQNFIIGYQVEKMSVSGLDKNIPVNDFLTKAITWESDNLLITDNEDDLLIPSESE